MSSMDPARRPFCRSLLSQAGSGSRPESDFQFFYGHGTSAGELAVLSNWYVLAEPFVDSQGNRFATSEHYMMYAKAILFNDHEIAREILQSASPGAAKALGRKVRGFDKQTWAENSLLLVTDGCELKFSQSGDCKQVLLSTGDKILVEAAPRDRIWGIGMGRSNPGRLDPISWRGQNLQGEALMTVRQRLRESDSGI